MKKKRTNNADLETGALNVHKGLLAILLSNDTIIGLLRDIDPNDWYDLWLEVFKQLEINQHVLFEIVQQKERGLMNMTFDLPEGVGCVVIDHRQTKEELKEELTRRAEPPSDNGGELPF